MTFQMGCAIWAYKAWVGDLFPVGSRATDFLNLYSRRFTTVEGNTTFYSIPDRPTVDRWAAETPEGFKFCLKLPRDITHQGILADRLPQAIAFLDQMCHLGDRLGPLFVQLPPSYSPAQFEDLATFLKGWHFDKAQLAVEVRHPDWFRASESDRLNSLLEKLEVGRVLLDTRPIYECPDDPQVHSERRKPQVPVSFAVTADFSLIRYISHPDLEFNRPYLAEWVTQVDQNLQQGNQVYFFVHCPVEERSPGNARYFQHQLERHGVPVPPLPWDSFEQPPAQLSLF
ncbi:MAG: DUF72 domain-containing protein [Oculatellaceae cyanobacterium bins.114]|nr:DUF72 domain-containing protein [Oculatellaceae cyanobacterium bins.114]